MKGGVYKNRYYMGVRPGLGARTRDDNDHGLMSMDRDRKPLDRGVPWFTEAMRGESTDESLWRESDKARCEVDIFWSTNNRNCNAFADHDDYRADWGTGR